MWVFLGMKKWSRQRSLPILSLCHPKKIPATNLITCVTKLISEKWQHFRNSCSRNKLNVKVHTLDIAPLRSESPPQKRSRDFTVLRAHPQVHPQSEWALPAFAFPAVAGTHLPTGRDGRLSRPWCEVAQAEIRTCNLPIANPALYHTATSAPKWNWGISYKLSCQLLVAINRNHPSPRDEVVINRIGHMRCTHSYLLSGADQPEYMTCQCPLTVKHILVNVLILKISPF